MYTAEFLPSLGEWSILDPEQVEICLVATDDQKDALLSHLNRG
jgi:hypothetical protein